MRTTMISQKTLEWIESVRAQYHVPGLAVGVIQGDGSDGDEEFEEEFHGFGVRNPAGDSYDEHTITAIGSNSKMLAALSVWILIDRGTIVPKTGLPLAPNTKVCDVIPEFKLADEYATNHATMDDLAAMRLGVSPSVLARMPVPNTISYSEQIRRIGDSKMILEFRERFQYDSNLYVMLARVVEILGGCSYPSFLEQNIFKPLKMEGAFCNAKDAFATGRTCSGYSRKGGNAQKSGLERTGEPVSLGWWTDTDGLFLLPAGGLNIDMISWMKLLREMISPHVLPASALKALDEPLTVHPSTPIPFGYPSMIPMYGRGQIVTPYRGHHVVYQGGHLQGQFSLMIRVKDKKLGILVTVNDGSFGIAILPAIYHRLLDEFLGLSPSPAMPYDKMYDPFLSPVPTPPPPPFRGHRLRLGSYYEKVHGPLVLERLDPSSAEGEAMIDISRTQGKYSHFDDNCVVARLDRLWCSHIAFRPLENFESYEIMEWAGFRLYQMEGSSSFVALARSRGRAIRTHDGIGMYEGFLDVIPNNKTTPITEDILQDTSLVQFTAEAWFGETR